MAMRKWRQAEPLGFRDDPGTSRCTRELAPSGSRLRLSPGRFAPARLLAGFPRRGSAPAVRFDRPFAIGPIGGHGPIRYVVSNYVPARWIRFRFTGPQGV